MGEFGLQGAAVAGSWMKERGISPGVNGAAAEGPAQLVLVVAAVAAGERGRRTAASERAAVRDPKLFGELGGSGRAWGGERIPRNPRSNSAIAR